jgi:hypothetical protein
LLHETSSKYFNFFELHISSRGLTALNFLDLVFLTSYQAEFCNMATPTEGKTLPKDKKEWKDWCKWTGFDLSGNMQSANCGHSSAYSPSAVPASSNSLGLLSPSGYVGLLFPKGMFERTSMDELNWTG